MKENQIDTKREMKSRKIKWKWESYRNGEANEQQEKAEKRKGFGKGIRENEFGRKRERKNTS